ncbi:two-component regulator propeller domain-containing protein, partial [Aquiflexum sp.]|uniref:ligand-binding sensor domain-containing protein n=1 Tax=Aquiflexum sp. TaxID=1872584 RepID=UPI003593D950
MKKPLFSFFAIFMLLLFFYSLRAQQITFNKVVLPTGDSHGGVGGFAQDKNGYMWIATKGGLFKYDGYRFKIFNNDPSDPLSLVNNRLENIYVDRQGIIWIISWMDGLDRLDPSTETFTHYRHDPENPNSLSSDTIRSIIHDQDGIFWIGTTSGLDRYDPKSGEFQNFSHNPKDSTSLSCNRVRMLYEDREGTLWVGTGSAWNGEGGETDEGGLNRFDKKTGTFKRYLHDPDNLQSLINNKVSSLFEDSRGTFWIGTAGDGLHTMDRENGIFQRHRHDPAQPDK